MSATGHCRKAKSGLYGRTGEKHPALHAFKDNEPLDLPVERFLPLLRFENREKLDDLGLDL